MAVSCAAHQWKQLHGHFLSGTGEQQQFHAHGEFGASRIPAAHLRINAFIPLKHVLPQLLQDMCTLWSVV